MVIGSLLLSLPLAVRVESIVLVSKNGLVEKEISKIVTGLLHERYGQKKG